MQCAATIFIDVGAETQLYGEQHSGADYNNFLVYQSYLLQLQWVCLPEQGNLKLQTLEGRNRSNLKKGLERGRKKERFRYQQETDSERDIYSEGDIRGSEKKGGAALAADYMEVCP